MIKNFLSQKMNDILAGLLIAIVGGLIVSILVESVKKRNDNRILRTNKNKAAMKELLPLLQIAEDELDNLGYQLTLKNYCKFSECISKLENILADLSNFLDKVQKPKKIRKRLKKKTKGKLKKLTFFEEVHEIHSMLDTIIFLGYGILELQENGENPSDTEGNFEEELDKTYLLIKKLKSKYKVY